MHKKITITIIVIAIIIGGIIFWQFFQSKVVDNKMIIDSNAVVSNFQYDKPEKVSKNLVEVFYLPHGPIAPIRQKIEDILQKFPEYELKEYDFYNDDNNQKIASYNLVGHIPVAIFIGGTNSFSIDGRKIIFENFPKGDAFVPTLEGSWNYDDLETVLDNPDVYKND